jgi:alpha/beta superfamily hydrolase
VTTVQTLPLVTDDGHRLEAELAPASDARAGMVLCHPHPQFGGTMRSIVISALFQALPTSGVTCLRFNFRGVEGSEGFYDEGRGERVDARAAVRALAERLPAPTPLVLCGWSFGGDIALCTVEPRISAWLAVAPPLHVVDEPAAAADDERPKLLALAEHDEVRAPRDVQAVVATWRSTEVVVVPGASHFFVGRTARLVELAGTFIDRLVAAAGPGSGEQGG